MHLLLVAHLLGRLLIDLVQIGVGHRGLGLALQHRLHQRLVAREIGAALEIGGVRHLARVGLFRQQEHVGKVVQEVVPPPGLVLGRNVLADVLLGESEVALMDLDTIDLRQHGIDGRSLGAGETRRCQEECGACCRYGQAPAGRQGRPVHSAETGLQHHRTYPLGSLATKRSAEAGAHSPKRPGLATGACLLRGNEGLIAAGAD